MVGAEIDSLEIMELLSNHWKAISLYERIALILGMVVFVFTYWISSFYVGGDQEGYRAAYSIVSGVGVRDARALYELKISGSDYFHFFLSWLASSLSLNKDLVMSIANGFLAAYSWQLFCAWGADRRIAALIVLSNFYMLILYFAAERLKFGMLFVILSLMASQSDIRLAFFAVLAVAAHVTVLGVGWGFWLTQMIQGWAGPLRGRARTFGLILSLVMITGMMLIEHKILFDKLHSYISARPVFKVWDVIPAFLLFSGALYYSRRLGDVLLKMGPLLLLILFLGGSRLNMLLYFVFLYYALRYRAGWNMGVLLTSGYLGWKSVLFVQNIFQHGHGFPA